MDNPLQQFLQQPKSVLDYQNEYAQADALKNRNALQNLALQQQQAATQQSLGERNALQRIAASSGGDRGALITGLRNSGLPGLMTQADALEKSGADLQTAQSTAAKNTADAAKTNQGVQQNNYTQAMQKVLAFQTPADAVASLNAAVASGKIDMQHATMMQRAIPQNDPAAFDAWKRQWAIGIADPAKMAELMAPHVTTMNTGGAQVTQAVDPVTLKPTTLSTTPITQSADSIASNATTRRGQDLTNSRAVDAMTKPFEVTGPDGTPVLVQQDKSGALTPVTGYTPKGAGANPKLNEGQGKATTFAARMADAESTIDALEQKGVSGTDYRTIAAGNGWTNWAASPEGQEYRQAQENWVTANLRQESGAAIGKDEMEKDVRKFFPAPWDSDAVKAQKARARSVAQQGMLVQAGPGAAQVPGILQKAGSGGATPNASTAVPADIAAILAKHGGK
jgi:hypothetical protein